LEATKTTAIPAIPQDNASLLNLLSEKGEQSFNVFIFHLEKANQVTRYYNKKSEEIGMFGNPGNQNAIYSS
jgi:hypothetical protein